MTTHDKDKIIAAAKNCIEGPYDNSRATTLVEDELVALYAIAFEAGRQAEREKTDQLREHVTLLRDVVGHVAGMRFSIVTTKMCEAALAATEPKP